MEDFSCSQATVGGFSLFDACCGSQEAQRRTTFAKAFGDFSDRDDRLSVTDLQKFLETLFARRFSSEEVDALARRVGSYTVYASLHYTLAGNSRFDPTLSFEEVEYIVDVCRNRGYLLRSML